MDPYEFTTDLYDFTMDPYFFQPKRLGRHKILRHFVIISFLVIRPHWPSVHVFFRHIALRSDALCRVELGEVSQ